MLLTTPITELKSVGPTLQKRLAHLGIETVKDALLYYPFRYEDYRETVPIQTLGGGEQITIKATIEQIGSKRAGKFRKILTEAIVSDETGPIRVVWFGQPYIAKALKVGDEIYLSGQVKSGRFGIHMASPSYEKVKSNKPVHAARLVPMYALTQGITQKQLRYIIRQSMEVVDQLDEWLPTDVRARADIIPLPKAVQMMHDPADYADIELAKKRLKFDELFVLQLRAEMIRRAMKRSAAPAMAFEKETIKGFTDSLPFSLTNDQKVSAWEIIQDMEKAEPMNRLLEGDVGSGKTVVAAMAIVHAVTHNTQSAIMAPTEILAKQHFQSFCTLLPEEINIALLSSNETLLRFGEFKKTSKAGKRKELLEKIAQKEVHAVVGTHALIQSDVMFDTLGLVIVDEQHRFGVEQRKTIRERHKQQDVMPHYLSMTATPIPRSFALTLYGDLDISIIREMPPGRKVIKTKLVEPHQRQPSYDFIADQVKQGRQVFVICPLIEQKDDGTSKPISEKKSVMDEYAKLSETIFPHYRVGFLHGKMPAKKKDETMTAFTNHELDILVSTSVVEVGVNIPNATVMMIEGAESFGLAQLHQFRGRVGRGDHQSYCFVFTDSNSETVKERLHMFEHTADGFTLSEYDLERRGPGDVYGKMQSGMMQLQLATLKDGVLIKLARDIAREIDIDQFPVMKEKVADWEKMAHLE